MGCNFDVNKCDPNCKKYAMCAYLETQKQLAVINQQLNILLKATANISENIPELKMNNEKLNEKLIVYTTELLTIIHES